MLCKRTLSSQQNDVDNMLNVTSHCSITSHMDKEEDIHNIGEKVVEYLLMMVQIVSLSYLVAY